MISAAEDGTPGNDYSDTPTISANGRIVAFASLATNLVPGGSAPHTKNVYVRDLRTAKLTQVNAQDQGAPNDANADQPALSANGRYLAFTSSWLEWPRPHNPPEHRHAVYVRDLHTGRTEKANVGLEGTDRDATDPSVSADGRYVAFTAGTSDPLGSRHIYVHDRRTGTSQRISRRPPDDFSVAATPSISADGRRVSYEGYSPSVSGPGNGSAIFVWSRTTGRIEQVDTPYEGPRTSHNSYSASLSPDGRYATFISSNLTGLPCTGGWNDHYIYIRDLQRQITSCPGINVRWGSETPTVTANSRYLLYSTDSLYLRDLRTGHTRTVSVRLDGSPAWAYGAGAAADAHSHTIAFSSTDPGIAPRDPGGYCQVYVTHLPRQD
ncbi:hypothetical protein [Streptomyces blastmyceticus]|uniref:PD40 domain-containing protein n=1 Tax=Streptomyces blastmyceticus TaxID=68180 RepID=A0ABN0WTF5_9ACTN